MKKKLGIEPREVDLVFGKSKPLTKKDQQAITSFIAASKQKHKLAPAAVAKKNTKPRQATANH
jgi:hypothetical protein